jgi:undecaprenyl-diphosphatase
VHPRINAFDARVDQAVGTVRNPALDRIFYPLSSAADHSLLWFIIGAARAAQSGDVAFALRFAAAMCLESAVTNGPAKVLFRRGRPIPHAEAEAGPLPYGLRRPVTSSFPSGHATAAFTAAVLLATPGQRGRWYALAGLVAASRVYVRMHHASDVVGGAALGIAMGYGVKRWVRTPGR